MKWNIKLDGMGENCSVFLGFFHQGHCKYTFSYNLNNSFLTLREDKWLSLIIINLLVKTAIILLPHKLFIYITAAVEWRTKSWVCRTIKAKEVNCFTRQNALPPSPPTILFNIFLLGSQRCTFRLLGSECEEFKA